MTKFVFRESPAAGDFLRTALRRAKRMDETQSVRALVTAATLPADMARHIETRATAWVETVRATQPRSLGLDAFLHEYSLSSQEGVALMCLAEALLRIPDSGTADALIRETIGGGDWQQHRGQSQSLFVNAATWALMLTGQIVTPENAASEWGGVLKRLLNRAGEPVVRTAVT